MRYFLLYVFLIIAASSQEEKKEEKAVEWPDCPTASADRTSSSPSCDPCSPKVYRLYKNEANTQLFQAYKTAIKNYNLQGWYRFGMGTGKVTENCPLQYTCGSVYPIWLNTAHPTKEQGIVPGEMCLHYTNGNCCTYKEDVNIKNCGNYYVYRLSYNKPLSSSYYTSYCVEPTEQPDICGDTTFTLKEDATKRGELTVSTSSRNAVINIGNDNNWFTFLAGKGTIKRSCPGLNHCGFKYPMWIDGEYPTRDGEIVHRMGHAAVSTSNICAITNSKPVYIVKCGDKFYHKFDHVISYSGFCVDEDYTDLCKNAVDLKEKWRGTTIEKARDHCDTNGLTNFEDWYRISVYSKKLPDRCVAPNKCGADNGYFVYGGHPDVGEGIVGRTFYYSSTASCFQGGIAGYILNCGNKDKEDYIYHFSKPSGCDKVFCAEQDPCSSTVYTKLDEPGRSGRTFSTDKINDATLEHGWYRFTKGEGIMSRSPVLHGHSGVTYPGWYDGEYPLEEDDETTGKACFVVNANTCAGEREVTVKNCKDFFVYHLKTTGTNYGYTYEEDVCDKEALKLDEEWRLQYNLDAVVGSDNTLPTGWYEVAIGNRRLNTEPSLYGHGGAGKYPGWMEGEHPSTDEGIVERTVYFTTSNTQPKGSNTKVYVINCGARFLYYIKPHSANYFYTISQDLCQKGSYVEVDQDYRLYTNPSEINNAENNDNRFFTTFTNWYRFMNGKGRIAEAPRINDFWFGGFLYPYQFPEGSHAKVLPETIGEEVLMEHYRGKGYEHYTAWTWKIQIANCGNYFLYKIPPLSSSYTRAGLVVDDDDDEVCSEDRYIETNDKNRLVSSTNINTGTSDVHLVEGWYRLTAGLGYMPSNKFIGTQCSTTYHGHLNAPHPEGDAIARNLVNFYSTNPASIPGKRTVWVKKCDGFYVYRLRGSPGTAYRYCEATDGCEHARELEDQWRVTSKKITTGKNEASVFGNDGWVNFLNGLKRMPESPPPKDVGGCTYNGYIDNHPSVKDGAVPRTLRFPGSTKVEQIQVQNCGEKYVYFLSRSISNGYCYAADVDMCSEDVYTTVDDTRRLHYSHKYGSTFTRFDLDNKFNGWIRYTIGKGRMMEEAPALTGMCMADYQGWINGTHPSEKDGTVKRQVCWRYNGKDCEKTNDISIRNCGDFYVYGISSPPPSNQYGHCVEQAKSEVCEGAKKLNDPRRGMLTPTTEYVNDQLNVVEDGYYRFMSGLGRLTAFPVMTEKCGGVYRMLIKYVREKDGETGDSLFDIQQIKGTSWTGTVYRNIGLQCDGYWVYKLHHVNTNQMAYCVEEEVCDSLEIKKLYSKLNQQWLNIKTGSEFHDLTTGWYQAMVGNKRLSHAPPDINDCGAIYPGYVTTPPPSLTDGIVPGKVCYRTNINSSPTSSCQQIYMKSCEDKTLYYLSKSPNYNYAMCIETDVCQEVDGKPLANTWRLFGTPRESGGSDSSDIKVGWYRVTIGDEKLAVNKEEAVCGATYPGWMTLGRHPNASEGTVNTQICYNTGKEDGANCQAAQVVNCGTHYLYHLRPAASGNGVCIKSNDKSMCQNPVELGEKWRSVEYGATTTNSDTSLPSGWYRFTTGLGRLATTCPSYKHGGGHYPAWSDEIDEIPPVEDGVTPFTVYWRYTSASYCKYWSKKAYVRNCGDYHVYWLPRMTTSYTSYTVEADVCSTDQYEVISDEQRLAWRPTTDIKTDVGLKQGWYRFDVGLKKINEECTPVYYGGTTYPGWMDGGHPDVGDVEDRIVYFRAGSNCKYKYTQIKVKNCGSFFLYRLVPTLNSYGYTIGSEPCDVEPKKLDDDDRSIFERSTSYLNDKGLSEGWYQFTTGLGVMSKSAPASKSCRSLYPVWMQGEDPAVDEGVVTRTICAVNGNVECQWQSEIKVRNCGNQKMMYYFTVQPPHNSARYCVENTMTSVCNKAKPLNDEWRGTSKYGTGRNDKYLAEGWYKFAKFGKRIANYPITIRRCGSTYPIWMDSDHVEKGSCKYQPVYQVVSRTNPKYRSASMMECQCMNGDYIYYHIPAESLANSYEGTYCVEEEPCDTKERFTGSTRSPWYHTVVRQGDEGKDPRWVKIDTGLGVMPTYKPNTYSCGSVYPGWYNGEMPTEIGQTVKGLYCFVTSTTVTCSYPREARVKKCPNGGFVYHLLPTVNYNYGYCVDEDVCDVATEEWGREEMHRLRYTSTAGYYSGTRRYDNTLSDKFWFKITIGMKRLPDECVSYMSCGTYYPGWLQGTHPTPEERIVDRQICFTQGDNCCATTKPAKVVSCVRNGKQYYLYRLSKTSSNYGYCIEESSDEVCKISSSNLQRITDTRHGTGVYKDTTFPADYQLYSRPGWFTVEVHEKTFVHYPPTQYFCGTTYAGWVQDAAPGPNDGVVTSRACYRENAGNDVCYSAMPLKMKNCNGQMRYLYAPKGSASRNMCVEQDICKAGNYQIFKDETWRLAYTKTSGAYRTDYRKITTSPYRGWIRFSGIGNNKLATIQQEYASCGAQYPVWMDGEHPTPDQGVEPRNIYATYSNSNYKWINQQIFVKNCGDFMIYNIDFNWYGSYKWGLCVDTDVCKASVTELDQSHRLANSWGLISSSGDNVLARGWYRFTNGFEKMPESCPIADSCGSRSPGYLSQPHPEMSEGIQERKVCFGDSDQCCVASTSVLVKNCGTHFVYRLYPTSSTQKYCVEENPDSMCSETSYNVLDDERRGENVRYDSTQQFADNTLQHGWYRFTAGLGKMPEYPMAYLSCGMYYPGYLSGGENPTRQQGVVNRQVCFSLSATLSGQGCKSIRVKNCGKFFVYELVPTSHRYYGYCVAQNQCEKATELSERWRLVVNPTVSAQSKAKDNTLRKGWYRLAEGHGTFPDYEPDMYYGGATYPSYMVGALPTVKEDVVVRYLKYPKVTTTTTIRVKNCGEHYVYWLPAAPSATYTYSIDTDVCLHARKLGEDWRNMFNVAETEADLHTDYNMGKDWYQFTTGFKMMAEAPPKEQFSCGTKYAAYLNQAHPSVEDGVTPKEVCYKNDDPDNIYQACIAYEHIRVKNCGDYFAYLLNPVQKDGAYCVYNRKSSCEPKVVHAKYGEKAVINCTLNSEKDFDSSEVVWTKLDSVTLPNPALKNMAVSDDKLLVNIDNIADKNAGVYSMYIPSTETSELVEVVLQNAVETTQKYHIVEVGATVNIAVTINVEPEPSADNITWIKLPKKKLTGSKYKLSEGNTKLTIKGISAAEAGTYRCTVEFEIDGVKYSKSSDVIVQLAEE